MKLYRQLLVAISLTMLFVISNIGITLTVSHTPKNFRGSSSAISEISYKEARNDIESPITTLTSGDSSAELTFPLAGGIDSNQSITLPSRVNIEKASLNLTGRPIENVTIDHIHDYTDTINNSAWKGSLAGTSPILTPADYMDIPFNAGEYNNILLSDDNYAYTTLNDGSSPYQLFEFTINETNIKEIYIMLEGMGYYRIGMAMGWYNLSLFIYNNSYDQWENAVFRAEQFPTPDFGLSASIEFNHTDYLNEQKKFYMMALGPLDPSPDATEEWVRCDHVYINVKTLEDVHPSEVTLNIGNDGSIEWAEPGKFNGKVMISDSEGFRSLLQLAIDNESDKDDIAIPLSIGSSTGGFILIDTIFISFEPKPFNPAPILKRFIPADFLGFYEDSDGGDNLIDLSVFFSDDDIENLTYEIKMNHNEINASLDPDGQHLDFKSQRNYFGKKAFQVQAVDLGLDGIRDTGDEFSTLSNIFNVTVHPTNDPPNIVNFNNETVLPEHIENGLSLEVWEDIPQSFTIECWDVDRDGIFCNIKDQSSSPIEMNIVSQYHNSSIFELTISAVQENIGLWNSSFVLSDDNNSGQLSTEINFSLNVQESNDPPKITKIGEVIPTEHILELNVFERDWLNFSIEFADPDPNEILILICNRTDSLDGDDISGMELIMELDERNGYFSFLADITPGIYPVNFTVQDKEGSFDWVEVVINVIDVNEAPITGILILTGGENNLTVGIIAQGFFDPNGDPLIYDWNMGDGGKAYFGFGLINVNHTYAKRGLYNVTLNLTDGRGGVTEVFILINVTGPIDNETVNNGGDPQKDDDTGPKEADNESSTGGEKNFLESGKFWIMIGIILLFIVIGLIFILLARKGKEEETTPEADPDDSFNSKQAQENNEEDKTALDESSIVSTKTLDDV